MAVHYRDVKDAHDFRIARGFRLVKAEKERDFFRVGRGIAAIKIPQQRPAVGACRELFSCRQTDHSGDQLRSMPGLSGTNVSTGAMSCKARAAVQIVVVNEKRPEVHALIRFARIGVFLDSILEEKNRIRVRRRSSGGA
jgi:hypothetical protein